MAKFKMARWRSMVMVISMMMATTAEGFVCPTLSSCTCQTSGNDYEVFCHADGTRLSFRILPLKYFSIECEAGTFDYAKAPKFNLGHTTVETFSLKGCPLPSTSLGEVISSLGITRAGAVVFQSNSNRSTSIERKHLKGLAELKTNRLTMTSNGFTSLPEDLFADVTNLTWINLRSNNVRLESRFFENLTKLETLELSDNHLTGIPDGVLSNLKSLKKLYLWHNNINMLQKEVFLGLGELKELDLSGNQLHGLPEEIFQHLENLNVISLYSNNFSNLPSNLFAHNKKLEHIKLFNNNVNLTTLPEYFLGDQENLKVVGLYRLGLKIVPENIFFNSTNIINISLADNQIEHLPSLLFQDQVNLLKLDLSNNRLKELPVTIFISQQQLEHLEINRNYIEVLVGESLEPLANLKHLSMNHNRLKKIHYNSFSLKNKLSYIDMSYNRLDFLDAPDTKDNESMKYELILSEISPFHLALNIVHLDLSHNMINKISTDWRHALKLEFLDLTYNNILEIAYPDVFFLSDEVTVDLRYNNITNINFRDAEVQATAGSKRPDARNSMSSRPRNVVVRVENNPIACNCILMWFIRYLRDDLDPQVRAHVNVDPGEVTCASSPTDLKGTLVKNIRPEELLCPLDNPASQYPKQCPTECQCFVRTFDMASIISCNNGAVNKIPQLTDSFNKMQYTELHLENNDLSKLEPRGGISEHVTKLFLNGNNLTRLSLGDIPSKIKVLNLSNNKLDHVNASIANMTLNGTNLQQVWLSHNPIACDCENKVFLDLIQKQRLKVMDYDSLRCSDGQMIKYLAVGNLCGTTPTVIAVSVLIALAGLIAGLVAAAYYKYNREIKVYLFAKGWCLWWVSEEELDKDKLYDAFISFSFKDEEFVVNKLVSPLEKGPTPFKLCVHFRDWVAGEMIPAQIVKSVQDSRRTVVVLSPNFLDSVWGRMEFRAAHSQALKEGRARVVVVIYGDIGATENLDPELQSYLSTNTYVKWGDPWFWDKLRYALPHPNHHDAKRHISSNGSITKKKGFDDRLELIHPSSPTTPPGLNTPPAHQAQTNLLVNHVNGAPNGVAKFPALNGHVNGAITMNGLKVNGNAKHSEV